MAKKDKKNKIPVSPISLGDIIESPQMPLSTTGIYNQRPAAWRPMAEPPQIGSNQLFKLGDTGDTVKAFQKSLGIPVTGTYDENTKNAVLNYQRRTGHLTQDGVIGYETTNQLRKDFSGDGDYLQSLPTIIPGQIPQQPQQQQQVITTDPMKSWQSKFDEQMAALGDTSDLEGRAKRQQRLSRVNALGDVMRNIADAIYGGNASGSQGAMITQHDHRQTLASLEKYQSMLDQVDAKKDRAKAMELNNTIHAMDLLARKQEEEANRSFVEKRDEKNFGNQVSLKGMDYAKDKEMAGIDFKNRSALAEQEISARAKANALDNQTSLRIAAMNNQTRLGLKSLANDAALNKAVFKNSNFYEVVDGETLHNMPKGIYWDIVSKASEDPELASDIKNIDLSISGEAAAANLNRVVTSYWKKYYDVNDKGGFVPKDELGSNIQEIFNSGATIDNQKLAMRGMLKEKGYSEAQINEFIDQSFSTQNSEIIK